MKKKDAQKKQKHRYINKSKPMYVARHSLQPKENPIESSSQPYLEPTSPPISSISSLSKSEGPAIKEIDQWAELKEQLELIDDKIKSSNFLKTKNERERGALTREVEAKITHLELLGEDLKKVELGNITLSGDLMAKESENRILQEENSRLLKIVLQQDHKIQGLQGKPINLSDTASNTDGSISSKKLNAECIRSHIALLKEEAIKLEEALIKKKEYGLAQKKKLKELLDFREQELSKEREKEESLIKEKTTRDSELKELKKMLKILQQRSEFPLFTQRTPLEFTQQEIEQREKQLLQVKHTLEDSIAEIDMKTRFYKFTTLTTIFCLMLVIFYAVMTFYPRGLSP